MSIPIEDVVSITVSTASRSVKRASFGVPILIAHHDLYADRARRYTKLSELVDDGWAETDPLYYMAQELLSQENRPEEFVVGRRANGPIQDTDHTVLTAVEGEVITVTISKDGTDRSYSRTVPAASDTTAEATALAALINADASGWGSGGSADFTCTSAFAVVNILSGTAGYLWSYDGIANLDYDDDTADPGLAADITAIRAADDDWYVALLDSAGGAENAALATALASEKKLVGLATQDSDVIQSGSSDIASTLMTASRDRAFLIHSKHGMAQYPQCAWAGRCLPLDPGSLTWAYKDLAGVTFSSYTTSELTYLKNKNCNRYIEMAGGYDTHEGYCADGTWIDRTRLTDWMVARIQEELLLTLRNNAKLGYNDAQGTEASRQACFRVYKQGARRGGFELSAFAFTAIKASEQADQDKLDRIMRDHEVGGVFTDAVHKFRLEMTLT